MALRIVLTTCAPDQAEALVEALLHERAIACANVLPHALSTYRWRGAVEREVEALVIMETSASRLPQTLAQIESLHPYEVPKIVALEVERVSEAYRAWVKDCLTEPSTGPGSD